MLTSCPEETHSDWSSADPQIQWKPKSTPGSSFAGGKPYGDFHSPGCQRHHPTFEESQENEEFLIGFNITTKGHQLPKKMTPSPEPYILVYANDAAISGAGECGVKLTRTPEFPPLELCSNWTATVGLPFLWNGGGGSALRGSFCLCRTMSFLGQNISIQGG